MTTTINTNLNITELDRKYCESHYDIVLLKIHNENEEYSTHVHNKERNYISLGHYFNKLKNARKDFNERT